MPGLFDDVPVTEQQDPKSKLSKGENCGDFVAGFLNPHLQTAGLPTLETGGLAIDTPVKMAKTVGSELYRHDQTPFTAKEMSKWDEGTFMVGGTGGTDSHAQVVGYNDKKEKGVISWAKGKPYWEPFEAAERKIRASGWNNWTATNPMSALEKRAQATGAGEDKDQYIRGAVDAAKKHGVDPDIYLAVIQQESGFDPKAKSPTGVRGISQMTLATGKGYGINSEEDRSDPMKMLDAGAAHLADLYREHGNWPAAIQAYNGGSDPNYLMNVGRHLPWSKSQLERIEKQGVQPQQTGPPAQAGSLFVDVPKPGEVPVSGSPEDWEAKYHPQPGNLFADVGKPGEPAPTPAPVLETQPQQVVPAGPPHAPVIPSQQDLMGMVHHATGGEKKPETVILGEGPQAREIPKNVLDERARQMEYQGARVLPQQGIETPVPSPQKPYGPTPVLLDRKIEFSKHLKRNLSDIQDMATQAADLGAQAMGIMAAQPPQDIAMNVAVGDAPTPEKLAQQQELATEVFRGAYKTMSMGILQPKPIVPETGYSEEGHRPYSTPLTENQKLSQVARTTGEYLGAFAPMGEFLRLGGKVAGNASLIQRTLGSIIGGGAYGAANRAGEIIGQHLPFDDQAVYDIAKQTVLDATFFGIMHLGFEGFVEGIARTPEWAKNIKDTFTRGYYRMNPTAAAAKNFADIEAEYLKDPTNLIKMAKTNPSIREALDKITRRHAEAMGEVGEAAQATQEVSGNYPEMIQPDLTRPAGGRMFTDEQLLNMTHADLETLPREYQQKFTKEYRELTKEVTAQAEAKPEAKPEEKKTPGGKLKKAAPKEEKVIKETPTPQPPETPAAEGEGVDEPSSYLYHGTPEQNLEDIKRNGLQSKTRERNDYEEGDRTPQEQELLYFERGENQNWGGKKSVQLRINEDMLPAGVDIEEDALRPGEFYTYHRKNEPYDIPPEAIEVYNKKTKAWEPILKEEVNQPPAPAKAEPTPDLAKGKGGEGVYPPAYQFKKGDMVMARPGANVPAYLTGKKRIASISKEGLIQLEGDNLWFAPKKFSLQEKAMGGEPEGEKPVEAKPDIDLEDYTIPPRGKKPKIAETKLQLEYPATGNKIKETGGTVEQEQAFKRDVRKFGEALREKLGYEHHLDKKGKNDSYSINIAPVGGDGTILLWKPNSEYGVYVSIPTERDRYEGSDNLSVRSGGYPGDILWRLTTKKDPWRGLKNRWATRDVTAGELADLVQREMERTAREEPTTSVTEHPEEPTPTTEAAEDVSNELPTTRGVPHAKIAAVVKNYLKEGKELTATALYKWADAAYGGTQAQGKYVAKDAYDAMELGVNQWIAETFKGLNFPDDIGKAEEQIKLLQDRIKLLPTQTKRTEEQEAFQQYSTPPALAYTVNWVANLKPEDYYLEPSAGVGGLAVFGKTAGVKKIAVNELSPRRAELLQDLGFDEVFTENAEQLNNILPASVKPTVVVMNPPFSATAGRMKGKKVTATGATHIEQALKRLAPGGRLVAIVGRGMDESLPTFAPWWTGIKKDYKVLANVGVSGKNYGKYGTTFDNRILVIDNAGPTTEAPVTGRVEDLKELIPLLQGVRDARVSEGERVATQPASETGVTAPESEAGSEQPVRPATLEGERQPGVSQSAGAAQRPERPAGAVGQVPRVESEGSDVGVPTGQQPAASGVSAPGAVEPGETRPGVSGPVGQPPERVETGLPAGKGPRVKVESKEKEKSTGELTDNIYEGYKPQRVKIKGAKAHPANLVESAAMSAVSPPKPTYTPNIPQDIIDSGKLSEIQLESIVYAGQAHSEILPDGETRRGFMIGDGTGVGKGREIAGVLLDNWNQGRKKGIWLSEKASLFKDAQRDLDGIGWKKDVLFELGKIKPDAPIKSKEGILYTTYDTMKSGAIKGPEKEGEEGKKKKARSRLDQLEEWLGKDFDGAIVFDEAHNMGNAIAVKGTRGMKKPSAKALAGIELQSRFPKARILYVSATGATEVMNLAYAERLGLWGLETPFPNKREFINQIDSGGVAAMELVARDMKAMGAYISRSLAYDVPGDPKQTVTYDRLEHPLTPAQRGVYDELANAWQIVLQNINAALEKTEGAEDSRARGSAYSIFWGAHQRFFNQIITSMKMPSVINLIHKDIDNGDAVIVQLVNTYEAQQERTIGRMDEGDELEDLDMTPRESLMQYLNNSFPTTQYETYVDEAGNEQKRPVTDSQGNLVENAEAVAMKEALLEKLGAIRVPEGPLELLINEFGPEKVAEVTGRKRRVVRFGGETKLETRGDSKARADIQAFQDDRKQILVFSEKGGTGASYHADLSSKNQRHRRHYLLQPGWRADKALQGLGRAHRSNQASAPTYILVTTDLNGEKRFVSSIARRLDQLGALTRGQRQAGSGGIFQAKDNLESQYARDALNQFWNDLYRGDVPHITINDFQEQTGLNLISEEGNLHQNLPDIRQFMNRILSMNVDTQNATFDAFAERLERVVNQAAALGTLDVGVENLKTDPGGRVEKVGEQTVYTDEKTGSETKYVEIEVINPAKFREYSMVAKGGTPYLNVSSGRVWMARDERLLRTDARTGDVNYTHRLEGPKTTSNQDVSESVLADKEKWQKMDPKEAKELWSKEVAESPKETKHKQHLITGAILPIWDRLRGNVQVRRVQLADGNRMIGRLIPDRELAGTLRSLGATMTGPKLTPKELHGKVFDENNVVELSNGWQIKRSRVSGENRIEITGPDYAHLDELKNQGVFTEKINWNTRFFIPTGPEGAMTLAQITKARPVISVTPRAGQEGQLDEYLMHSFPGVSTDQLIEYFNRSMQFTFNKLNDFGVRLPTKYLRKQMGKYVPTELQRDGLANFLSFAYFSSHVAETQPAFKPMYDADVNGGNMTAALRYDVYTRMQPYMKELNPIQRAHVDKLIQQLDRIKSAEKRRELDDKVAQRGWEYFKGFKGQPLTDKEAKAAYGIWDAMRFVRQDLTDSLVDHIAEYGEVRGLKVEDARQMAEDVALNIDKTIPGVIDEHFPNVDKSEGLIKLFTKQRDTVQFWLKDRAFYLMPHTRWGPFWLHVYKKDVKGRRYLVYAGAQETTAGLQKMTADAKKKFGDTATYDESRREKIPMEMYNNVNIPGLSAIMELAKEKISSKAGIEAQEQLMEAWQAFWAARGWGGHMIRRSGVPGYEMKNMRRVYADYVEGYVGMRGKMTRARGFTKGWQNFTKREGGTDPVLQRYTLNYTRYLLDHPYEYSRIRRLLYHVYLGASMGFRVLHGLHALQTGWPVLSTVTKGSAMKLAMAHADRYALTLEKMGLIKNARRITPNERRALEVAKHTETIQDSFTREIAAKEGSPMYRYLGKVFYDDPTSWGAWVADKWKNIYYPTESDRWLRESFFLAALRGIDPQFSKRDTLNTEAIKKAIDLTKRAYFRYARGERPPIGRGLGSIWFAFQTWVMNFFKLIHHMATEGQYGALMRLVLASMAIGGSTGGSFWAYPRLKAWYRKTYGKDLNKDIERHSKEMFGENWGTRISDTALYGLPAGLFGFDLSQRMIHHLPFAEESEGRDSWSKKLIGAVGGPFEKLGYAASAWEQGQPGRAAEQLMPNFVANPMKAYRMYKEGATTISGRPIAGEDLKQQRYTFGEAFIKALGGQPLKQSKEMEQAKFMRLMDEDLKTRKTHFSSGMANALKDQQRANKAGDTVAAAKAKVKYDILIADLVKYNKEMQTAGRSGDIITGPSLKASIGERFKPVYPSPRGAKATIQRSQPPRTGE